MTRRTAGRSRARANLLLLAAFPLLLCCASAPKGGFSPVLSGRVTFLGAPVPGAAVTLSDRYDSAGKRVAATARCGEEGEFTLPVAPGTYYAEAEGVFEGKPVHAFSGQNPLRLENRSRWLGMKAVERDRPEVVEAPGTRGAAVEGEAVFGGRPVEDAYLYVYSSPESLLKGMGIAMAPPTGPDGRFLVEGLPESGYFLVARRRASGGMTGPLEKGDLYGFYPGNPLYLRDGAVTKVRIEMVEKEKGLSYSEVTSGPETVLTGRAVDRSGNPQAGVYAFVYDDRVFGHKRPYAHSGRTGPDGTFAIYIERPGVFYLGARENFGNSPVPGERFGFYDGSPDHSITAGEGEAIGDLTVVVDRILEGGAIPGAAGAGAGSAEKELPVRGIRGEETWRGEVTVRGSVVVQKGARLTILPGTVVRFEKIDVDGDGIGDSELYVEGELVAEGTVEQPIRFTSAEKEPAPKDWKYLFINLSPNAVLSHCISEYAFSGVQIHFSRASVSRCLFRNNVDGLRFSTAQGTFERNRMTGNVYGVRYEERNSKVILTRNDVTENRVGIFCVTESKGAAVIRENRIHGNADYDFKLGNRQRADVPARENWWGTADPDRVRARIFDREDEPELGRVLFEPLLAAPPPVVDRYWN